MDWKDRLARQVYKVLQVAKETVEYLVKTGKRAAQVTPDKWALSALLVRHSVSYTNAIFIYQRHSKDRNCRNNGEATGRK